jgi:hypothetical protein
MNPLSRPFLGTTMTAGQAGCCLAAGPLVLGFLSLLLAVMP